MGAARVRTLWFRQAGNPLYPPRAERPPHLFELWVDAPVDCSARQRPGIGCRRVSDGGLETRSRHIAGKAMAYRAIEPGHTVQIGS